MTKFHSYGCRCPVCCESHYFPNESRCGQPFENGDKVVCINNSPDVWLDGSKINSCQCIEGNEYTIEFMVYSTICGWLIATPRPVESVFQELHKACDFKKY